MSTKNQVRICKEIGCENQTVAPCAYYCLKHMLPPQQCTIQEQSCIFENCGKSRVANCAKYCLEHMLSFKQFTARGGVST